MVNLEHPFTKVVLGNFLIAFQLLFTVYFYVIPARIKCFGRDHMKQFDEIHREAFGPKARTPRGGYPDTGNGWYS